MKKVKRNKANCKTANPHFNRTLICGSFPSDMKLAKIIPVFKSGDRFQFFYYRPISLFPNFLKYLKKIFHKRLTSLKHNTYCQMGSMASEVIIPPH